MYDHNQKQDSDEVWVVLFLVSPTLPNFGESHLQAWCHLQWSTKQSKGKVHANFLIFFFFFCLQLAGFMSSLRMLFCELMGKKPVISFTSS